ncbi:MAG TPA: hypothetical protein VGK74_25245 [Symbiobacteriaceae bacterium]|jgi:hypothetical protein
MMSQFDFVQGYEIAKARHDELVRELVAQQTIVRALKEANSEQQQRRRFFRMYQLRSILFRLVPRLAGRLTQ